MDPLKDRSIMSYLVEDSRPNSNPFILEGDNVVVGRNPKANIVVHSLNVSRMHAVLRPAGETSWNIKDNHSMNGVYVNKEKLPPGEWHVLKSEDAIHLGPPSESDWSVRFVQELIVPPVAPKRPKLEALVEERLQDENRKEEEKRSAELVSKLRELEEQLREKERIERELQEQLLQQERQHTTEREHLLREKEANEVALRKNLEETLEAKERMLREALDSHHHREELQSEAESKAKRVEDELAEVLRLRERARADAIEHFGSLMETEFTCSICSELFVEAVTLPCAHTFCRVCIAQWKKKKKECPICRTKIKGNSEIRSLAIDNFIDGTVVHLDPQVALRRRSLVEERSASEPRRKSRQKQKVPISFALPPVFGTGSSASLLFRPFVTQTSGGQPIVSVARTIATSASTVGVPDVPTLPGRQHLAPATASRLLPFVSVQQIRVPVPGTSVSSILAPHANPSSSLEMGPSTSARNVATRSLLIENNTNRSAIVSVCNPATSINSASMSSDRNWVDPAITINDASNSSSQSHGDSTSLSYDRNRGDSAIVINDDVNNASNSSTQNPADSTIVISDDSNEEGSRNANSDSSIEGNYGVFYGGYGRCFSCNRRGHWSNGCPFDN